MSDETVTLVLRGDAIAIGDLTKALSAYSRLLAALRADVPGGKEALWYVDSLGTGSAMVTARCIDPKNTGVAARLVETYERAGKAYQQTRHSGFSPATDAALDDLASVVNSTIRSVRLETANEDIDIAEPPPPEDVVIAARAQPVEPLIPSVATVQGRVETIARHKGLRFTLYEWHTDRAISCYLAAGYEESMRETWGRLAVVEGEARYDPDGRVTTLRNVSEVDIVPEVMPEECLEVIGAYTPKVAEPPEDTIRRMRDA